MGADRRRAILLANGNLRC